MFKSAFNISFWTIISRILGFLRDIFVAYKIGAGGLSDILFIALKIPNFFRRIFAEGAFSLVFVPIFSKKLVAQGDQQALFFARRIFVFFVSFIIIFIFLAEIFMPQIMYVFAPGYVAEDTKFSSVVFLSRITFPYILLISIATFFNGILNSYKKFIPGSLLPIIYNLGLIFALFFFGSWTYSNIISLAVGVIFAGLLQLSFMFVVVKKSTKLFDKKNNDKQDSAELKRFLTKLLPAILAASIIQLNSWVDTIIASLIPNAVSYIYYSDRLVQLPLAIIAISLSVALLPSLSQAIKKNDKKEVKTLLNNSLLIGLFFALPATMGLFILAKEIVILLFARGEFDQIAVLASSNMLKIYVLALPAYIFIKILLSKFYAKGDTKTPVIIAVIILLMNLTLNLILIQKYSYLGIAIATVISSWFNVFLLIYLINKKDNIFILKNHFKKVIAMLFNIAIIGFALLYAKNMVNFNDFSILLQIFSLLSAILSSIIIYCLLSIVLKIFSKKDLQMLLSRF